MTLLLCQSSFQSSVVEWSNTASVCSCLNVNWLRLDAIKVGLRASSHMSSAQSPLAEGTGLNTADKESTYHPPSPAEHWLKACPMNSMGTLAPAVPLMKYCCRQLKINNASLVYFYNGAIMPLLLGCCMAMI